MFIDLTDTNILPEAIDIHKFSEILISETIRAHLQDMLSREEDSFAQVFEKTTIVQVDKQYVFFPNQWYYLAVLCKKYAEALMPYCNFIDSNIRNHQEIQDEFLLDNPYDSPLLKGLVKEQTDRERLVKFVKSDKIFRDGKALINKKDNGGARLRATKDVFGSTVLKKINVPDASSNYLGNLIYYLAKNSELYNVLENEIHKQLEKVNLPDFVLQNSVIEDVVKNNNIYRKYISAIKSKPFLLLAGISGTGKSRIVRELARSCWEVGTPEYEAHKPRNFEMIQVKPNWHDSSELIGYLSNINGTRFIAGKFLEFVVKAWSEPEKPYFLCLDEMNLAPVEQYFAEYLSVIESRKLENGKIVTDAILSPDKQYSNETVSVNYNKLEESWYVNLINDLLVKTAALEDIQNNLRVQFKKDGITIPQNLIVVGTVNMDETTFSFSRKVLDRAMTIEMNEVDLHGGLENKHEKIGLIGKNELIGDYVEGSDVYSSYKEVCDKALDYLKAINDKLEGTPFKVAYRTRNEFLLYVVNNLPYNKDEKGNDLPENFIIARALDEITNMKILSRIEGDETKFKGNFLEVLCSTISSKLAEISGDYIFVSKLDELKETDTTEDGRKMYASVSMAKLDEMKKRLESGYTSFWS